MSGRTDDEKITKRRGCHDKIVTVTKDEVMKMALEGDEIILGGVEVQVHFVHYWQDPGIIVEFRPLFGTTMS
jgi:hypothetical protein